MTITSYKIQVNDIKVNGAWLKQIQYVFEQVNRFGEVATIYKTFDEVPAYKLDITIQQAENLVNSYASSYGN